MRVLQLSDPHLVARSDGVVRGKPALPLWQRALEDATRLKPDLLLVSGDLCQDESWAGYRQLQVSLETLPAAITVALLAGNHDHPSLLRAVLGRRALVAPAELRVAHWRFLLLSSHLAGQVAGALGRPQRAWLQHRLADPAMVGIPTVVALHHPPLAIGDPGMDAIGLRDGAELIALLRTAPQIKAVLFGHIHQHWQGQLPGRPDVQVLGCPSTLASFEAVQPCPIGRPDDPGGRWLELADDGSMRTTVLRWSANGPQERQ